MLNINKRGCIINTHSTSRYREFWNQYALNNWEEETFCILDRFTNKDKDYIDIGSWIGPTVLYAAHKSKRVFAFDPDPHAFNELVCNIKINSELSPKIVSFNAAITQESGTRMITGRRGLGTSETSFLSTNASDDTALEVRTMSLSDLTAQYIDLDISLVKIDIEGFEFELIPAIEFFLKNYRPTLYISLHKQFLAENFVKKLTEKYDYTTALRAQQIGYVHQHVALLTMRIVESLSFYEKMYSVNGDPISLKEIVENSSGFVVTNEEW